jgi:hypothetical protein
MWEDLREIGWRGVDWVHLAQDRGSCSYNNGFLDFTKVGKFLSS